MIRRRSAAVALLLAAGMLLAGCTGGPGQEHPGAASAAASSTPHATAVALTCEGMIPAATVKAFTAAGWTAEPGPLYVGDIRVAKGLQCTWGGQSSERAEVFGRGPIDAATAKEAEKQLLSQGWRRIDAPEGVYITAGKDMILNPDDEGFGMTYLFTDGWVKVASTKQGILLIADPS
ncbi:hypothetical protein LK09_11575 [Microbacterium mangrovi]|uniref:Lipoprotein n=1 Tax=Microbacterium mangrovi TaxID=1348253 RepID=A0A0B2A6N2_9MICO|nr:hypothetical protein [Microbacterium mangrovi]KHK97408.1 hypothetical protein LK09_11575 [Microbacterium mangrovi]